MRRRRPTQLQMNQNTTLNVATTTACSCNDTDVDSTPLTAALVKSPLHGNLALNANGSFVYQPTPSFCGTESFTYTANDVEPDARRTSPPCRSRSSRSATGS